MRIPAKFAFSWKYKEYGILGVLGLVDHGSWEPGMVRMRTLKDFDAGLDQRQRGCSEAASKLDEREATGGYKDNRAVVL